jgi:peroxiredoxin
MPRFRYPLLLFVFLFVVSACKTSPDEGVREAPEVGALAPGFTLTDTGGEKVSLADHRGKVVLINFWATWCPPCRQEMPGINARYQQHQGKLEVLAIDNDEPLGLVSDFQEDLDLSFKPLLDPQARVQILYQVRAYPTSMFVNENGMIEIVHIGLMTEGQLDDYLAQMGLGEETASN